MTGAREGRSDGGNKQQQESGPALFPRLHVAETKKAGPRGPPRNKMALYEQLTIPSHKFKPSPMPLPSTGRTMKSPSMTTPLYLPIPQLSAGSHDSMYSYVPMSYMNPTMMSPVACIPVMNMGLFNADAVTSSMNTSGSKSTIMDGAIESPVFGGGVTCMPGHSKHHAPTEKGRGDDDFEVPTYSSATQSSGQTRPSSPLSPLYIQKAPQGQRALPRINKESVIQKRSPLLKGKTREVASVEHKDDGRWSTASGECVTLSITGNDVDSQEADHRELERIPSSESSPATAPTDKVCRTDSLMAPSEQDMFSNISLENQSGEGSEPSQQRRGSSAETGSSMLENVPADSVQFQDVVSAFGQQEFWKTQMIMIRQQRIFSRQVFELHRVIEVQQLLAKTLCTSSSIDEALEKEDDNVHMPGSPVAEVPEVPQAESPKLEVLEVPVIAAEPVQVPDVAKIPERRPETNENSGPIQEAPRQPVYPLSVPTQQVFNPEVPWQAPPYAAWGVRMASPFMYVPYPGPYPPGYGTYPVMGAPLPMYAQPGALQQPVRFPTWQQPGMPPLLSAQGSAAVPAWYAQQSVPVISPAASRGIASPLACHVERFAPSESGQSVESTLHMADARQAGQGGARLDVGVNPNEGNSGETSGRAKGWSRKEGRWVRGDRNLVHKQQASDVADLRGNKANYQNGDDTARGGGDHNLGRACGQQQTNESYPVVEQATTGATTTHVAPQEGTSLKHMRSEGDFGPGACRWFPILSPAKRPMHHSNVIKVLPRAASATPELAANILLSIQTDRRR